MITSLAPAPTGFGNQPLAPMAQPTQNVGPSVPNVGDDDEGAPLFKLSRLQKQFERYLGDKREEVEEAKDARRQYHGVQWSAEQVRALKDRGQPPTFFNKISRKVDGIVGISEKQRQDPKAYPRNPQDEDGADVATTVIRYIMERNEWTSKKPHAFRQALTDGIGGVEMRLVDGDHKDPDIEMHAVEIDDFFYDPASIRPNFTDARYMGLSKWMDVDEAVELFPDKEDVIRSQLDSGMQYAINSDRDNKWTRSAEHSLRMVEHWYRNKGQWCWAFYIGSTVLAEGVSPFMDERGKTACRFEMFSAMIDHDGDRYGIIRNLKPLQENINQRLSVLLRLALTRRVIAERGAVDDVELARREWARPDGWIETNGDKKMVPDNTQPDVAGHTQLLQLAMNEMEAFYNINPAALSGAVTKNLSGRAVNALQAPGLAELVMLLINYRNWIIRVYRMSWNMAQRFWQAERWIRVTDDQKIAQFVQVNGFKLDQYGQPALVNLIGALDVDIILDEGPDVQNMMQDSLDVLTQFLPALPPGSIPMEILVKLLPIPGDIKTQWEQKLEDAQKPDPVKQQAQQIALHSEAAKIDNTVAGTNLKKAQALSALGSAAHKTSESHIDGARVFAGGLAQVEGSPQNAAATAPPAPAQPQQGPAQLPSQPLPPPPSQPTPGLLTQEGGAMGGGTPMPGMLGPQPMGAPPMPRAPKQPAGPHVHIHAPDEHLHVHVPVAHGLLKVI